MVWNYEVEERVEVERVESQVCCAPPRPFRPLLFLITHETLVPCDDHQRPSTAFSGYLETSVINRKGGEKGREEGRWVCDGGGSGGELITRGGVWWGWKENIKGRESE